MSAPQLDPDTNAQFLLGFNVLATRAAWRARP